MQTWLHKLCEPLLHPKYPQIKGSLVRYGKLEEIIGKCAEGEIMCQNQIKLINRSQALMTEEQLLLLGVPKDLIGTLQEENGEKLSYYRSGILNNFNLRYNIAELNDYGFSYIEIAEYLITTFEDAV